MIELFLSTDGKHTVHVSADTVEQMAVLVPHAKTLYQDVLATYGTKAQMWGDAIQHKGNSASQPVVGKRADTVAQARDLVAPLCPAHQTPMTYRKGRYGDFWSCHTRKPDGHWCNVTYEVTKAGNGHATAAAA
jgi:hypothetical protein